LRSRVQKLEQAERSGRSKAGALIALRLKDEDEYPGKARLFWPRYEHFFQLKPCEVQAGTASAPSHFSSVLWGQMISRTAPMKDMLRVSMGR
jgi:hypothetical protein